MHRPSTVTALLDGRVVKRRAVGVGLTAAVAVAGVVLIAPSASALPTPPLITGFTGSTSGSGVATATQLTNAPQTTFDSRGNLYTASCLSHNVVKVSPGGAVSVVAGSPSGVAGPAPTAGSSVPATGATLGCPVGVAVDSAHGTLGTLYVSDTTNHVINAVDLAAGTMTRVAGSGTAGVTTTPTPALSAQLDAPNHLALDGAGSLYVADAVRNLIYKVVPGGSVSVIGGQSGSGSTDYAMPATGTHLEAPFGVAVDTAGNVYFANQGDATVAKIDTVGGISVVAGTSGSSGTTVAGTAVAIVLKEPTGISLDGAGNLYIADSDNGVSRVTLSTGLLDVVAGTGTAGAPVLDGPATSSPLQGATSAVVGPDGQLYINDLASTGSSSIAVVGYPAPPSVTATGAASSITASWTAPSTASHVTGYTATASPGSATCTATAPTLTCSLAAAPGSTHTVTVVAHYTGSDSTSSAPSAAATALAGGGGGGVPPPSPASTPTSTPTATPPTGSPVVVPAAGVHRLGGRDRIATSAAVSAALFPTAGSARAVVLSTSARYTDAIAGARLASARDAPLLLTDSGRLDADVAREVERLVADGGTVWVLGGGDAVAPEVERALTRLSNRYVVRRLAGDDRYETAVAIADQVTATERSATTGEEPGPVYLASGVDHPDGLAVSALAARTGGVVLLTAGATMPSATREYLAEHDPTGARTVPVGGPAAAAAAALPAAAARAAASAAIVGADRYDTARRIAARFPTASSGGGAAEPVSVVGLATGQDWPDALVGSAAMGELAGPLLLTTGAQLHPSSRAALEDLARDGQVTTGIVFGQGNAITASTAAAFEEAITRR